MSDKPKGGLFGRLSRTRERLNAGLGSLIRRGVKLGEALLKAVEDQLMLADIGIEPAPQITESLNTPAKIDKPASADALLSTLIEQILSVTKLDGTAKGGIIVAITEKHDLPSRFIGVDEAMDNFRPFVAQNFAKSLLPEQLSCGANNQTG